MDNKIIEINSLESLEEIGILAQKAAEDLYTMPTDVKNDCLNAIAIEIKNNTEQIITANLIDVEAAKCR